MSMERKSRKDRRKRSLLNLLVWALAFALLLGSAAADADGAAPDYSDPQSWVYCGAEDGDASADVFFIAPSAFGGGEGSYIMDLTNEKTRGNYIGVINMEKGIYDRNTRF